MFPSVEKLTNRPAAVPGPLIRRRMTRALTLVEVLIATLVLGMVLMGILATVIQSRRMTEGSVVQNSANAILQGYIEQMKTMAYETDLVSSPTSTPVDLAHWPSIPCVKADGSADPLYLSLNSPPNEKDQVNPTGGTDNLKLVPIKTPAVNPNDTITFHIYVWVNDLEGSSTNVTQTKSITIIYNYEFIDGGKRRTVVGSLRSIRSAVPSF